MKKVLVFLLLALMGIGLQIEQAQARKRPGYHHARSYTRKDGTHVSGYNSGSGALADDYRPRSSSGSSYGYDLPDAPRYSQVSPSSYAAPDDTQATRAGETLTIVDDTNSTSSMQRNPNSRDGLPNTGGAPLPMFLSGAMMMLGGLAMKRKYS